jgi:hypothetical protein
MNIKKTQLISMARRNFHIYIFPLWTLENRSTILVCALISFLGGVGGAALLHYKIKAMGTATWHVGLFALLVYFSYYIRGVYQKYLDCAWDVYY